MELRRVLFATDFSAASEAAAPVAGAMARRAGAALLVVHVIPPLTDPSFAAESLAAAAAFDVPVETALLSGRPGPQIVDLARRKGVDLIVLGTHGRTGVSRAILGSVAEHVVRTAPCMVLTVPATLTRSAEPAEEPGPERAAPSHCIVCAAESPDLICETCRTRIRGEALEQKLGAERAGRRGSPA
jgi:nucleotide-binding universal stress UspA family protein